MKRYRLLISLVAGFALALGFSATAMAGDQMSDCAISINKVQSFGAGAGQLRNTSTACGQSGGSSKTKSVTVVAGLVDGANGTCPSSESREVTLELTATNEVGGMAPIIFVPQQQITRILSGGSTGRYKFSASYNQTSCAGGEGPVSKADGGVNELNEPGFRWHVRGFKPATGDSSDEYSDSSNTAPLLCKPCRTSQ